MKRTIYILFIVLLLVGCRTSKTETSQYKQTKQTTVAESLTLANDVHVSQAIGEALQKAINERLSLTVKQTVYDTSQPTDTATGKRPVLAETSVELTKDTETTEQTQTQTQTDISESTQATAAKLAESNTDTSADSTIKKKSGNWYDYIILLAGFAVIFAVFFWYERKKL